MLYQLVLYFSTAIGMMLLYFLPGLLISSFFKKFNNIEKLAISFLFSTILFFSVGIVFHLFGLVWPGLFLLPIIAFVCILLPFRIKFLKRLISDKEVKLLLILFFIIVIFKATLQIFISLYPMGSDYIGHYKSALFFLGPDWSFEKAYSEQLPFPSRSPGFYMLLGSFLSIFGEGFWVAQIANVLLNTVFIFPLYCLIKKSFSKKIAIYTLLFLQLTPLIEISLYIFAKMIVAYFSILFFYLLFVKKESGYLLGATAGLALLVHQSSLPFIVAAFLPFLFQTLKTKSMKRTSTLIKTISISLLVLSPWFIFNYANSGEFFISTYTNFPIMTNPEKQGNYTTGQLLEEFKNTSISYIFYVRAVNFVTAVTPAIAVVKATSQFIPMVVETHEITNFVNVPWVYHHYHSLSGQLTILLYVFVCLGLLKLWKTNKSLFYFILIPIIFYVLWYGWVIMAVVRSGLTPIIPLLVAIGLWEVNKKKNANKWIKLIFILAIVEILIFSIFYSWHINQIFQMAIERGELARYESLFSAYKLFGIQK